MRNQTVGLVKRMVWRWHQDLGPPPSFSVVISVCLPSVSLLLARGLQASPSSEVENIPFFSSHASLFSRSPNSSQPSQSHPFISHWSELVTALKQPMGMRRDHPLGLTNEDSPGCSASDWSLQVATISWKVDLTLCTFSSTLKDSYVFLWGESYSEHTVFHQT